MLIISAETRWFHHGQLPDRVREWFCEGDDLIREQPRTDRYLNLGGCTTVGVKLREGRFEIKARRAAPRALSLFATVNGLADGWVKWSSASPELGTSAESVSDREPQEWLPVRKERWLRWLDIGAGDQAPGVNEPPVFGCTAELTEVTLGEIPWWTFALEAMGDASRVDPLLVTAGQLYLKSHPVPLPLDEMNAASYPVWLARNRDAFLRQADR